MLDISHLNLGKTEKNTLNQEHDSSRETKSNIKTRKKKRFRLLEESTGLVPSGNITYIVAFVLPLIMYIALYYIKEIYPFGNNVYLRSDCYHQYAPFFSELWEKIKSGDSLWYSWDIGMGTNFISLFAYYLASPVNFIIAFFPQKFIPVVMDYIIATKLSIASLAIVLYISKHFNTKKLSIVPFGIFYAFSGFLAAYSWNIMWLDCIILFPLIILGLERLVNQNKGIFYCIMLGLCIYTNYYISIMVCISVVLYFIVLIICYEGEKSFYAYFKKMYSFAFYSLLAGGLAAILLLPEIYTFSLSASSNSTFPSTWSNYFSIIKEFTRHLIDIPVHTALEHHPNIYCGVAILIFLPLYVISKQVKPKEKITKMALLLIFLISFNLNIPNYIWHGFHYPNSLPARQSFIYIFFVLIICFEAFKNIKNFTNKELALAFWISMGFLVIVEQLFVSDETYDFKTVYISGAFILLYALLIYLKRNKKFKSPILLIACYSLCIIEATINMDNTGLGTTSLSSYQIDFDAVENVTEEVASQDDTFYRMDKVVGARTKNDGAWHNYHSISNFSSTSNAGMSKLFGFLGIESSTNAYGYNGSTLVTNSLFSVKYLISNKILNEGPLISYVTGNNGEFIYKNENVLPVGYLIPSDAEDNWNPTKSSDGIVNTNSLVESITGISNVFTLTYEYGNDNWVYFNPVKDGHLYLITKNSACSSIHVTINDSTTRDFTNIKTGTILDLGYYTTEDDIEIDSDSSMGLVVYTLEERRYVSAMEQLNESGLNVTDYSSTSIEGTIDASEDGNILFSIPYDDGWTVYIDGKKVETSAFKDALLMVSVSEGSHTVNLKYTPVNSILGIVVSIISIIILIVLNIISKKIRKKEIKLDKLPVFLQSIILGEDVKKKLIKEKLREEIIIDNEDNDSIIIDDIPEEEFFEEYFEDDPDSVKELEILDGVENENKAVSSNKDKENKVEDKEENNLEDKVEDKVDKIVSPDDLDSLDDFDNI